MAIKEPRVTAIIEVLPQTKNKGHGHNDIQSVSVCLCVSLCVCDTPAHTFFTYTLDNKDTIMKHTYNTAYIHTAPFKRNTEDNIPQLYTLNTHIHNHTHPENERKVS